MNKKKLKKKLKFYKVLAAVNGDRAQEAFSDLGSKIVERDEISKLLFSKSMALNDSVNNLNKAENALYVANISSNAIAEFVAKVNVITAELNE